MSSRFDPFGERPFVGWIRIVLVGAAALLVLAAPSLTIERVTGASGEVYRVYEQNEVWRAVGPVLSIRFRTSRASISGAAAEAADLLPYFAERADSAAIRYVLIRATRPALRLGTRLGVYRAWNFRYERGDNGWVNSGYW